MLYRREFIACAITAPALAACVFTTSKEENDMYGLIGKFTAASGQRDALIAILLESIKDMPGCRSYIVAKDESDADGVWITEVWDSKESHDASLKLPAVREAIARARPLIAGFGPSYTTSPVGGAGLA